MFKDVDLTKSQDKTNFSEYAKDLKQRIENKSGAYDNVRLSLWKACSERSLDRLQIAIDHIDNIKCNVGFTSIPSLGTEGWMIMNDAGLFWNPQCQVSLFDPVTKFQGETLFRLHTTSFALADTHYFRLKFLREVVKQANYIIFDGSHFFPMEVPPDDSELFEVALDYFCGLLINVFKLCMYFFY